MHRTITLAALAFAGCSALPAPDSLSPDMTSFDPLAALVAETGHPWTMRARSDGTPAFLEGRTAPLAATAADALRAGRQFLRAHAALIGMRPGDDFDPLDAATDDLGFTHAHFQELAGGHPVFGGELLAHFATDGALVRVNGRYVPVAVALPDATVTADGARVAAVQAARAQDPSLDANAFTTGEPKLYVYPSPSSMSLAWRVVVSVDAGVPEAVESFVDAVGGNVIHAVDTIAYLDGSGIGVNGDPQALGVTQHGSDYWLEDTTRGSPSQRTYSAAGGDARPGITVKSKDPASWDTSAPGSGAAVDAHAFAAAVWDHFATLHGRAGFAGDGKGTTATVHFGAALPIAFFDGKQLVFGDGDGVTTRALSGGLDVVAHEFTHGVIAHSAMLGVEGEPAALQEGIADAFACFVDGNWQIGEAVAIAGPLRDVANPAATGDAVTMLDFDPAGDPHVNGTIAAHAAWQMAQSLDAVTVEKIWYRALTRYLWSSADFADAADATTAAARDLAPDAVLDVRAAWVAASVVSK
jgi:bacillolysin